MTVLMDIWMSYLSNFSWWRPPRSSYSQICSYLYKPWKKIILLTFLRIYANSSVSLIIKFMAFHTDFYRNWSLCTSAHLKLNKQVYLGHILVLIQMLDRAQVHLHHVYPCQTVIVVTLSSFIVSFKYFLLTLNL